MFDGREGRGGKNISLPANRDRNEQGGGGKGQHEAKTAAEKRGVFFGHVTSDIRERDLTRALAIFRFQTWETRCPLLIGAVTAGYIIGLFLTNDGVIMTVMHNNNSSSTRGP